MHLMKTGTGNIRGEYKHTGMLVMLGLQGHVSQNFCQQQNFQKLVATTTPLLHHVTPPLRPHRLTDPTT